MTRNVALPALAVALALIGLALFMQPGSAQSHAPNTTLEALNGETVVIFFGDLPYSGKREVIQLHGKVTAATAHGIWIKPTVRYFRSSKEEKYEGDVYVPWTSIAYTKILKNR